MQVNNRRNPVKSEPYYRGAGLIGNSIALSGVALLIDAIAGDGVDWHYAMFPLVVILTMFTTKSVYVNREDRK